MTTRISIEQRVAAMWAKNRAPAPPTAEQTDALRKILLELEPAAAEQRTLLAVLAPFASAGNDHIL